MAKKVPAGPRRPMSFVLASATILLAGLLIWQCADIYRAGTSAQNMTQEGVRIHDIYSREVAAERFSRIAWAAWFWLAALAAAGAERIMKPLGEEKNPAISAAQRAPKRAANAKAAEETTAVKVVRIALGIAALALIVLGVRNGGMWDVLVKAINICTECVGLG